MNRLCFFALRLALLIALSSTPSLFAQPAPVACPVVQAPASKDGVQAVHHARQRSPSERNPAAGLYLFEDHVDLPNWREMYHAGISSPDIDGAAVMLNWKSIEPSPGHFCWDALDLELSDVLKLGKTFTIGLVAGGQAPTWLYDTVGVPALRDVTFNATLNKTGKNCQKLNQPLVWDARYIHQYAEVMVALANHLKRIKLPPPTSGTAFDALVAVKLSGINVGTEELRLDQHPATPSLAACPEPDVAAMWKAHGYRSELVYQAWVKIADLTAGAYPGKLLNMDVIVNGAFPNIDVNGNTYPAPNGPGKKHVIEPLNAQILKYAIAKYKSGLMVQWDALSQDGILPLEVTESGKQGALMGYQMNGFGGGNFAGSGCIYNPGFVIGPCRNVNDYAQALLDGIQAGGHYIEVQPPNVAVQYLQPPNPNIPSFLPAFAKAQQVMRQQH